MSSSKGEHGEKRTRRRVQVMEREPDNEFKLRKENPKMSSS